MTLKESLLLFRDISILNKKEINISRTVPQFSGPFSLGTISVEKTRRERSEDFPPV